MVLTMAVRIVMMPVIRLRHCWLVVGVEIEEEELKSLSPGSQEDCVFLDPHLQSFCFFKDDLFVAG